jgi:hypothetical protein
MSNASGQGDIMQKPIVSLFDESVNMVRPWAERGFTCYCYDKENDGRVECFPSGGSIHYVEADLMPDDWRVEGSTSATIEAIIALDPCFVFGFGPCDDLAVCGAKHFAGKRERDPDFQRKAVALWRVVETVGIRTGAAWFGENPRSSLSRLYRRFNHRFDPSDFGGYLPENDVHPKYPNIIPPRDAYTKDTWIWTGNGFRFPRRRPVPDIGYFHGWAHLGGKSKKTKQIRSETPRGWAIAVFFENWTMQQFA